jgi:hypothetical protein
VKINRRRFMQAAGLSAGSLFLPSLLDRSGRARGQGAEPPMRLFIMFAEHGVVHDNWGMRGARPADQGWDYDLNPLTEGEFSPSLRPLYRHRDQLTVIDGLSIATGIGDPYGDGHAKGWCSALTGGIARETFDGVKSNAAKISLDQIVGNHARSVDPTLTNLTTMEFGVFSGDFHAAFYREGPAGQPPQRIPMEQQPQAAFDRLFPNGDGSQPPDPVSVAQPDVLSSVATMYDRLSARASTEDRQKLEAHRDLVRDMEAGLRRLAALDCGPPTISDYYWGEVPHVERWQAHTSSFLDLTAVAFSCGISRVTSMLWGDMPPTLCGGVGDLYELHHAYAHPSDPNNGDVAARTAAQAVMTQYTANYAGYAAALADRLAAIPEGNGSVLDNTIILWVSDISHGGHGHDRWPMVLLGGKNKLRTGRYINAPHDTLTTTSASWVDDNERIGLPHNHVLVAVAQAMGVPTDTIGDASVAPKKPGAPAIDLRGPLPGLLR